MWDVWFGRDANYSNTQSTPNDSYSSIDYNFTYYYRTAFSHRLPFYRVYFLPLLFYRVYNLLTAYPQTAYLVHNRNFQPNQDQILLVCFLFVVLHLTK